MKKNIEPNNFMPSLHSKIAALVPTLTGWCSSEMAQDLALAVIKARSSVTVEIGVWGGRSLIPMALAHQEQDHGIVWAIDPWSAAASVEGYDKVNADWWGAQNHDAVYKNFIDSLRIHGVEQFVNVVRKKSDDVEPPSEINVLSIDGQHTDQASRDVERYACRVVPSGFVFMDDIAGWNGAPARAVEKLLTMGFTKLFERGTGAMFQREDPHAPKPEAKARKKSKPEKKQPISRNVVKKKLGRPAGSKNKPKAKSVAATSVAPC